MPREPQRSNLVALCLVGAGVLAAGGWLWLRAMAQGRAEEAYAAAGALADCVERASLGRPLPAAIDLMLPTERPFAACEEDAKRLATTEKELSTLPLLRGYPPVIELGELSARLTTLRWSASALDIAKERELGRYSDDVLRAAELACLTAQKVGLDTNRECLRERASPPELPARRLALETNSKDATISTVVAEGNDKDVRVFFLTRSAFWFLHSKDAGQSFRYEMLKLDGKERELRVAQAAEGRHYAVLTPVGRPTPAKLLRITARDRIELARELDLPADLDWLPAGAPVFEVHDGENLMLALALVARDSARGRVAYLDNTRIQLRKVPEGKVLGAIGVPPSLVVGNTKKKSYDVATYAVPNATNSWPKPKLVLTSEIESIRGLDVTCGAPKERYVPFISDGPKAGTLLALQDGEPNQYAFSVPSGRTTSPVCGRCSPSILTSTPAGPELWLPAQHALTSQLLTAPLLFRNRTVWPTAKVTCAGDWHALTWVSEGRLFVQSVEVGTWQTSAPTLLAQANDWGAPEHVTSVATRGGIVVFWWRLGKPGQLRIEYATSADGKTWT